MKRILLFLTLICLTNIGKAQIDTITFESFTSKILIDSTSNNLWQIGKPQKVFFDSAFAGKKAILTDTILDYPPNDTSTFIYIINNQCLQNCITCMSFWHKYDMDSIGDKGLIDASYDGGNSWLLLKDTFDYGMSQFYSFFWDSDYHLVNGVNTPHKLITSGRSEGWIQSTFCWQWYPMVKIDTIISPPDSLMVRFTFISDSLIKNKEGWMIDDFYTFLPICSGINEENSIENIVSVYPNPANNNITIESLQKSTIEILNIQGQTILQQKIQQGKTDIDISSLAKGIYILRVTSNDKTALTRIIKE